MAHCGFEGTAVDDTCAHPLKALKVALRGPQLEGPLAPDPPFLYDDQPPSGATLVRANATAPRAFSSSARRTCTSPWD